MMDREQLKMMSDLSRSNAWKEVLKSFLERQIPEVMEPANEFEATKSIFDRLARVKLVKRIIDLVENAEEKITY
jgi:hypothetical protein